MTGIIGLMVARDEADLAGHAIISAYPALDGLVCIDHGSHDGTSDVVIRTCKALGLPLYLRKVSQDHILESINGRPGLREMCYLAAMKEFPDMKWTFTVDADMYFTDPALIRSLADKGEYDAYWFRTLNASLDIHHIAGLNPPHVWLIRAGPGRGCGANYTTPERYFKNDPNRDRFIGWNLTYLKPVNRIFWRRHIPGQRRYNKANGATITIDEYVRLVYKGPVSDQFKREFVLGIFQPPKPDDCEKYGPRTWDLAKPVPYDGAYGDIPAEILHSKLGEYKMLFNDSGICIGREPDMIPEAE